MRGACGGGEVFVVSGANWRSDELELTVTVERRESVAINIAVA